MHSRKRLPRDTQDISWLDGEVAGDCEERYIDPSEFGDNDGNPVAPNVFRAAIAACSRAADAVNGAANRRVSQRKASPHCLSLETGWPWPVPRSAVQSWVRRCYCRSNGMDADHASGYCARAVFREARLRIPLSFSTRSRSLG